MGSQSNLAFSYIDIVYFLLLKGIVPPKMKISLGLSDIPLSDEHILSYIQHCPVCSNLYNSSEWCPSFWIQKKSTHPSQNYSTQLRGVNKGLLMWNDALV